MSYYCRGDGFEAKHCDTHYGVVQCDYCYWYQGGNGLPHYPVPAIPLQVVWPDEMNYVGYKDMVYIDSLQCGEDDPIMVCCWDFHETEHIDWQGKYQRTYIDSEVEWYKQHNAWGV